MATLTYNAYFSGGTATTGLTGGITNPHYYTPSYRPVYLVVNEVVRMIEDPINNKFVIFNNSHGVPTYFYSASMIGYGFHFMHVSGTKIPYQLGVVYSNGSITSYWDMTYGEQFTDRNLFIDFVTKQLTDRLGSSSTPGYYYNGIVTSVDASVFFKDKMGKILYDPNAPSIPLTVSVGGLTIDMDPSTSSQEVNKTCLININMSVKTLGLQYTTHQNSPSLRFYNGTSTYSIRAVIQYCIKPTGLEHFRDDLYENGRVGTASDRANHQDFITNNNGWKAMDNLIKSYTITGVTSSSSYTSGIPGTIIIGVQSSTGNVTNTFQICANGYNFFANSACTQNVASGSYNTYSCAIYSYKSIYVKSTSGTNTHRVHLCLYDEDEGQISYTSTGPTGAYLNKYFVPPTDIIQSSVANTYTTMNQATHNTYGFHYSNPFIYKWNGGWINYTESATSVTPTYLKPGLGYVQFTTIGNVALPQFPEGMVATSYEHWVNTNKDVNIQTSVRYHLTGNRRLWGGTTWDGAVTWFLWVGVKKNTLDFINSINAYGNNRWSDTIGDVTYNFPMAYANKLSTFSDLVDKMTVFHGKAIGYYANLTYFLPIQQYLKTNLWTNIFASLYSSWDQTFTPVKYRKLQGNFTLSELDWPMRWYNYPTWTSETQTKFTYYAGLVMKKPSYFSSYNGDLYIAQYISESNWNSALNSTVSLGSGGGEYIFVYYNGLRGSSSGGSWPLSMITNHTNVLWNYNRRAIGNHENDLDMWYDDSGYLFGTANRIYDWIRDTTSYFSSKTDSSNQRWISYTGTTWITNDIPSHGEGETDMYNDIHHRVATNDILYTQYKSSDS